MVEKRERFLNAFMSCWEVYKDKEPSETLLDTYYRVLQSYSPDEIVQVFSLVLQNLKWFPKPVELMELLGEKKTMQIEDIALEQAHMIISHVKTYGSSISPETQDPITKHLMIRRWPYYNWAANLIESEEKWWIKEFCDAYRSIKNTGATEYLEAPEELKQIANSLLKGV